MLNNEKKILEGWNSHSKHKSNGGTRATNQWYLFDPSKIQQEHLQFFNYWDRIQILFLAKQYWVAEDKCALLSIKKKMHQADEKWERQSGLLSTWINVSLIIITLVYCLKHFWNALNQNFIKTVTTIRYWFVCQTG